MPPRVSVALFAAALLTGVAWLAPARASSCSSLASEVDDARTKLRRAANETDLEDAKDLARRAYRALGDAANAARDCGCDGAASEFDTAASRARRARDADDGDEFSDQLSRSIRAFNFALSQLRSCSATRR